MENINYKEPRVIRPDTLRKLLGILGVLLPIFLAAGVWILERTGPFMPSISDYYYTVMRNVFVSFLVSFGLFLFTYKGNSVNDDRLTNIAGLLAILVAFFPTSKMDTDCEDAACYIHFLSAAGFLTILAFISYFIFTMSNKPKSEMTPEKIVRNKVYRICGIIMMTCIVILAFYFWVFEEIWPATTVFWLETIALWAFGVSWLTKGEAILGDK